MMIAVGQCKHFFVRPSGRPLAAIFALFAKARGASACWGCHDAFRSRPFDASARSLPPSAAVIDIMYAGHAAHEYWLWLSFHISTLIMKSRQLRRDGRPLHIKSQLRFSHHAVDARKFSHLIHIASSWQCHHFRQIVSFHDIYQMRRDAFR